MSFSNARSARNQLCIQSRTSPGEASQEGKVAKNSIWPGESLSSGDDDDGSTDERRRASLPTEGKGVLGKRAAGKTKRFVAVGRCGSERVSAAMFVG